MEMTMYVLQPTRKPAHILLVDDDPDFRGMIHTALSRGGYTVHEAANGRAALELLQDRIIDLVLTDIIMPEADGYEIIQKLKSSPSSPPLIAVSGGSARLRMELPNMARLLGADAAFEKPVDINLLLDTIKQLLEARRAGRAA
ncbi:response regulator [Azospirillum cavernae]|uniref:Response regulator n=2 Tax=Azospirillum cavernae TaxID=2320860 RepID=A0A418VT22_9PROT|nr:response regulator [Azospirillum cavernae]